MVGDTGYKSRREPCKDNATKVGSRLLPDKEFQSRFQLFFMYGCECHLGYSVAVGMSNNCMREPSTKVSFQLDKPFQENRFSTFIKNGFLGKAMSDNFFREQFYDNSTSLVQK